MLDFMSFAPSLPGFGFSGCSDKACFRHVQDTQVMHKLMLKLGYNRHVVQGGDCGSKAIHLKLIFVPLSPFRGRPRHDNEQRLQIAMPNSTIKTEPSYRPFETRSLKNREHCYTKELGYYQIQNSNPRTLDFNA